MARFRELALDMLADFVALVVVTVCVWSLFMWVDVLGDYSKLWVAACLVLFRFFLREVLPDVKIQMSSWRERAADDDNSLEA